MKRRKIFLSLREKLSITQADFAASLGISRSLLAMYENGLRQLPTPALLKLGEMEIQYDQLQQKKNGQTNKSEHPDIEIHWVRTKNSMHLHCEACQYKKTMLEDELKKMISEYGKAESLMSLLNAGFPVKQQEKIKPRDKSWQELQRVQVIKKLARYGKASQAKLQAKIEVLEAEHNVYRKWMEQLL